MRLSCLVALLACGALAACGAASGKGNCSTPGAIECVSDSLARVCAADGTWVSQACNGDQTCMGSGGCVLATDISCNATDSGCVDSTHASVCNSDGKGFQAVTCPPGTTCQGFGTCVGTCVVGSSRCSGSQVVQTCSDGFTYADSNCMPGTTTCVGTSSTSAILQTAACMPASCVPQGTLCGNKATDATSTDPNYASTCVSSPSGLHWQSEQCAIPGSCVPGSGCNQQCAPGDQRCNGNGVQTCGANGAWSSITACQPSATGAEQVCQYVAGYSAPVCGDPVCTQFPGACEADGFHECVNGKVSAMGGACAYGICVSGTNVNGYNGGSCQAQCNPGDSRCAGTEAYEGCDANYRWSSSITQCPANGTDSCIQYTDHTNGSSKTICAQCAPSTHRCTDSGGTTFGTFIETCDATGHWGSPAQCSMGQCQSFGSDAACTMQCTPNATVCLGGSPATPPDPQHPGTTNWGTCDANGNLPTTAGTACAGGTSCRKHSNGQIVGSGASACVQCVGSDNEAGFTDTACITTASPNSIETCSAGNTWNTPTVCSNTSPYTGACRPEGNVPACRAYYYECSNSILVSYGYGGCSGYWGLGVSSGVYGTTPDCCLTPFCETSSPPAAPAACQ